MFEALVTYAKQFRGYVAFAAFVLLLLLAIFLYSFSQGAFDSIIANFGRLSPEQFFWFGIIVLSMFFVITIILIFLSFATTRAVQETSSSGTMTVIVHAGKDNSDVISGATVRLQITPRTLEETSNANGEAIFFFPSQLEGKKFKLNAGKTGYENNTKTITLKHESQTFISLNKKDAHTSKQEAEQQAPPPSPPKNQILIVFANPRGSSSRKLNLEDRAIREAIRRGKYRDNIDLIVIQAATVHDLRRALLDHESRIVHISGHGTGIGLLLEDQSGGRYVVPQQALADLFAAYSHPNGALECVILNACYSLSQGEQAIWNISYTIAIESPISDDGAIVFSQGFYDAIGAGRDIEFAYKEGCRAVQLAVPNAKWNSILLKQGSVVVTTGKGVDTASGQLLEAAATPENVRALVGLAVDLSGSMAQSIKNDTGGHLSRLESFRQSVDRLVQEARSRVKENATQQLEASLDLFVYGFGLRNLDVCDLLSLLQVSRHIITREEIEALKERYIEEARSQYSGYEGLGDLARDLGLGGFASQAERVLRDKAEANIRQKIMQEVTRRLRAHLADMPDTTLSVEEVAQLWDGSGEMFANAESLIFGMTPMKQAFDRVLERFQKELASYPEDTQAVLFVLSDGEPTDGDPLPAAEAIKALGVTVISCFVTDQDVANPRMLYGTPEAQWNAGARLMFKLASQVDDESKFLRFLLKKGWTINPNAKLFVQINYSEVLDEFIRVVLSPLEEGVTSSLPRGV